MCSARSWSSVAHIGLQCRGWRRRGARSSISESATGRSGSVAPKPRRAAIPGAAARSSSGLGLLRPQSPSPSAPGAGPRGHRARCARSPRLARAATAAGILARGPGPRSRSSPLPEVPFEPRSMQLRRPTEQVHALRQRGSPSHDGLAAGWSTHQVNGGGRRSTCSLPCWAPRAGPGASSAGDVGAVRGRAADGRWLAVCRAGVAGVVGRPLGAGRWIGPGRREPMYTMGRELAEEWSNT